MVEWNGWFIAPERVVAVKVYADKESMRMEVVLDNGDRYHCDYAEAQDAKAAARRFAERVGLAMNPMERVRDELLAIRTGIALLDKRQRKLWRKLKEINPDIGEADEA